MNRSFVCVLVAAALTAMASFGVRYQNDKRRTEATLSVYTMEQWWPSPDPELLSAVRRAFDQYHASAVAQGSPFLADWSVTTDDAHGVVETSWFRTHKGEVTLKAIAKVSGPHYRVDVWQKTGAGINKFFFAFATERELQEAIETEMMKSNKAL